MVSNTPFTRESLPLTRGPPGACPLTRPGLIRFVARDAPDKVLIGEPESDSVDVGVALRDGREVKAVVWSGSGVLQPGSKTDQRVVVDRVLSPLSAEEVGTIRCIGLNVSGPYLDPGRHTFWERTKLTRPGR